MRNLELRQGLDATNPIWSTEPERLVPVLAAGLRVFHEAPVSQCPFDCRLDLALAHIRRRVAEGLVEPARDFHDEFSHLSAESALALLEQTRPESESPVVCHGDYCLPNVLIADWSPTGFVDLGELGVLIGWVGVDRQSNERRPGAPSPRCELVISLAATPR